jgi:hypothetical protein
MPASDMFVIAGGGLVGAKLGRDAAYDRVPYLYTD